MNKNDNDRIRLAKKAAGEKAVHLVKEGMLIGLGTGSTASFFIEALGKRCREGLNIRAVCSSKQTFNQAKAVGIPLEDPQSIISIDLTIDGADEIDPHKNMIKGGGGALLRERVLAGSSKEFVVIVDETKLVERLGGFPVPVEIASFAYRSTLERLSERGYKGLLRVDRDNNIYTTDNGNYIFDIEFKRPIVDPENEGDRLRRIIGVLETGLFFQLAGRVIIGYLDGSTHIQA